MSIVDTSDGWSRQVRRITLDPESVVLRYDCRTGTITRLNVHASHALVAPTATVVQQLVEEMGEKTASTIDVLLVRNAHRSRQRRQTRIRLYEDSGSLLLQGSLESFQRLRRDSVRRLAPESVRLLQRRLSQRRGLRTSAMILGTRSIAQGWAKRRPGGHLKDGQWRTGQNRPVRERRPRHECCTAVDRDHASLSYRDPERRRGGYRDRPWVEIAAFLRQSAMRHVTQDAVRSLWSRVRQLRGPQVRTCAWWSRRSSIAATAAVSPRSLPQSSTGRFEVSSVDARS